jgi:ribosomal protein L11 methylase PrmA
MSVTVDPASFRDPSGFVFRRDGVLYRQVQPRYGRDYDLLLGSGLYDSLADAGLLVRHHEVDPSAAVSPGAYRVLKPEPVPFISYPYEWCFSQLKDAALATLQIQKTALGLGLGLKDASAYNVQFVGGRPVFIDTLSFERYEEGSPWAAYGQFCRHFLAPLALMSRVDIRQGQLLRLYVDGIPLDLAARLLPGSSKLNPGLLAHIHLHGGAQKRCGDGEAQRRSAGRTVSRAAIMGLLDSLEGTIRKLHWQPEGTEWADYYGHTNYTDAAMESKRRLVGEMLDAVTPAPRAVWDLGANTGAFSRVAAARGADVVAWDVDPAAVERNYLECRKSGAGRILPLLQDLTSPSPGLGWASEERRSLLQRGPADVVMALALVHHLAISNNVPLPAVARFLQAAGKCLIIEFVPKADSQVQRLLAGRPDIFDGYTREGFEAAFAPYFETLRVADVTGSQRSLFLLRARPMAAIHEDRGSAPYLN